MSDDIDIILAGPELDRLIAEKVMGWKLALVPTPDDPPTMVQTWFYPTFPKIEPGAVMYAGRTVWRPSRDIADAWEVVEHLQYGFKGKRHLYLQTDGYGSEQWRASWHRPEECPGELEVEADTAPLAICRAALKAVR